RRVVLTVAHASAAPFVAARGGLVATLNERMAQAMASRPGLAVLPLPFLPRSETVIMAWHPRHTADPAHAWLRRQVPAALSAAPPAHQRVLGPSPAPTMPPCRAAPSTSIRPTTPTSTSTPA